MAKRLKLKLNGKLLQFKKAKKQSCENLITENCLSLKLVSDFGIQYK